MIGNAFTGGGLGSGYGGSQQAPVLRDAAEDSVSPWSGDDKMTLEWRYERAANEPVNPVLDGNSSGRVLMLASANAGLVGSEDPDSPISPDKLIPNPLFDEDFASPQFSGSPTDGPESYDPYSDGDPRVIPTRGPVQPFNPRNPSGPWGLPGRSTQPQDPRDQIEKFPADSDLGNKYRLPPSLAPAFKMPNLEQLIPPALKPFIEGYGILVEDVRNFILERRNSTILGDNLEASGRTRPDYDGAEPHHVIPSGDRRVEDLRQSLKGWGIDINDADNGVWLPGSRSPDSAPGAYHPRLNNDQYRDAIREALRGVRSPDEARETLRSIGERLKQGEFPGVRPREKN